MSTSSLLVTLLSFICFRDSVCFQLGLLQLGAMTPLMSNHFPDIHVIQSLSIDTKQIEYISIEIVDFMVPMRKKRWVYKERFVCTKRRCGEGKHRETDEAVLTKHEERKGRKRE